MKWRDSTAETIPFGRLEPGGAARTVTRQASRSTEASKATPRNTQGREGPGGSRANSRTRTGDRVHGRCWTRTSDPYDVSVVL
ncbi:MAG: hypothetical protein OXO56_10415, partial [Gammaproteobacteria bacterium]|nr:hypothetical protein [Gammaproteobacteria bacterium]